MRQGVMPKYVSYRRAEKCINFVNGYRHTVKHYDYTLRSVFVNIARTLSLLRSTRRAILEIKIDAVERFAGGLVFGEAGRYPGVSRIARDQLGWPAVSRPSQ